MRVATDVGGTFTDLVCLERGRIKTVKVDTTAPHFESGVMDAIDKAGVDPAQFQFFAHGTTVVINALLGRQGARVALITTRGFRDVLEIARANRPDLFNFAFIKPAPFVLRRLRFEISERIDYFGEVVQAVQLGELDEIVPDLEAAGVEAVAVCLLHAYINPEHERAVVERLRVLVPKFEIIASHEVCREWREYERTSTTVLSAYVLPLAKQYLGRLQRRLYDRGLRCEPYIMQSNAGIATIKGATGNPISMVESGPSSGVLGAIALGNQIGEENLITLDIGGTTAKCALIHEGKAEVTTEYRIEWDRTNPGYPIRTPVVEIVEIGNGGGSIAWMDEGGRLHVGPQSAGAVPGPAAYGRGGSHATTTDANLVLGRINPDLFLAGAQKPDFKAVESAFQGLVSRLGGTTQDVARGVLRIANANMVNALKLVSLNKGHDPRNFTLVAFGGGGPMHALALAREIMVSKVIIPVNSSVFSAWGMLMTDLRRDFLQTHLVALGEALASVVADIYARLESEAISRCVAEGMPAQGLRIARLADMRYQGQEHTIKVKFSNADVDTATVAVAIEEFHSAHERKYTFRLPNDVELVNFHVAVFSDIEKQSLQRLPVTGRNLNGASKQPRVVDFDELGIHVSDIYDWALLEPGMSFKGPAIVEDSSTALVVDPQRQVRMDDYGNLHIEME
jgi:N-methylhydantoinase A